MTRSPFTSFALVAILLLGAGSMTSCGMLSSLGQAARESSELDQRYKELDEKLDMASNVLESYGPLAEDLGPEFQERYEKLLADSEKVRGYVEEGKSLVNDAMSLHQRSMEQAKDPDTGETDWMKYAMLMLAGGGGLYSERRKTAKDRKKDQGRLHERLDKRKGEASKLEADMAALRHEMEVEKARRETPPSA